MSPGFKGKKMSLEECTISYFVPQNMTTLLLVLSLLYLLGGHIVIIRGSFF